MSTSPSDPAYAAETQGPHLNIANWVLTAISLVFLGLRLYCKSLQSRGLWWDDHFLTASWVTLALSSAFNVASVNRGFGHHISTLSPEQKHDTSLLYGVASTFLITASAWSKTSFAITLLRITKGKTRHFVWFLIISMNLTKAASAMISWISCQPLEASWNTYITEKKCWDKMAVAYYNLFSGAYSGAADLVLALLPWKVIMGLQMKTREKIGVAVAMSMGVFAAITAFIKCAKIPTLFGGDFTYEGTQLIIWGSAETATTIMAASIPVLRVLFREIRHTERGGGGGGGNGAQGTTGRKSRAGMQGTVVSVTASRHQPPAYIGKQDDRSDKSILNDSTGTFEMSPTQGKIMRTKEVMIDYQDRNDTPTPEPDDDYKFISRIA